MNGLVVIALAATLSPESPPAASFALIVGVNHAVDDQPPLRYADDDAARFFDQLGVFGAKTYLLADFDDNTARLHPQAAAEATLPSRAELQRATDALRTDVDRARARGMQAELYVVYAGHGDLRDGRAYLTLNDDRVFSDDLANIIDTIAADRVHVIIDACYAYFLAYNRGPGGRRRPLVGFSRWAALAGRPDVGLLLSTSTGAETHEWEGFQAGVFSHEVRSALYGAADADNDSRVSYREVAAFVQRANAAIPNERFRPDVVARPPETDDTLVDLRPVSQPRLRIPGTEAAHYILESEHGVRLAELHNSPGQPLSLVRPEPGRLFLLRPNEGWEYTLPAGEIALSALEPAPPRTARRGAAHVAFNEIFSLPFDQRAVDAYVPSEPALTVDADLTPAAPGWQRPVGWGALALGVASAAVGGAFSWSAAGERNVPTDASQVEVGRHNDRIGDRNATATVLYVVAGTAAVSGLALLLWPDLDVGF